jgi:hypothetical protein
VLALPDLIDAFVAPDHRPEAPGGRLLPLDYLVGARAAR